VPPRAEAAGVRALESSTPVERARARLGAFAELSKFGIVLLVLVSAGAGFMLSAPLGADFPWMHGLIVLLGVMLLSSGASALNQVQERDRDALMARTANRPLPSGRLAHAHALAFAALAMVAGAVILWIGIGRTAGVLGLVAAYRTVLFQLFALAAEGGGAAVATRARAAVQEELRLRDDLGPALARLILSATEQEYTAATPSCAYCGGQH